MDAPKRVTMSGYRIPHGKEHVHPNFRLIYNRLSVLEDKMENGGVIELPCKLGDKVYKVVDDFIVEYMVCKIEVTLSPKRLSYCLYCHNYELGDFDYFYKKQIGKTVFLTKVKAEEKIKLNLNTQKGEKNNGTKKTRKHKGKTSGGQR